MEEKINFKIYKVLVILLNLISCFGYSQDTEGSRVILTNQGIKNTSFYLYKPSFKAKAIYNTLADVKNQYPEELMSSIFSVTSQE